MHNTGKALNASNQEGVMLDYITTSNLYWNHFDLTVVKKMRFTEAELEKCTVSNGDLLICEGGDVGRAAIWNYNYDIRIQNHIHRLKSYLPLSHAFYYYIFYFYKSLNLIGGKGVAIQGLSSGDIHKLVAPLPPIAEQQRIVREIERWFAVIDKLETSAEDLKVSIQQTKSRILDLALSGKLVPQDPDDEPAIELLKRVNPDFKPCDSSHYPNLPKGWSLARMGDLSNIISGVSYAKTDIRPNGIRILRSGNIQDGKIVLFEDDIFIDNAYYKDINTVKVGDIILVASTGSSTLIGKTGYAYKSYQGTQIGAFLRIIRPKFLDIGLYLNMIFLSDYYREYIRALAKGTNINNVKNVHIEQFIIPIPPFKEQQRMVNAIVNIWKSLDSITAEL